MGCGRSGEAPPSLEVVYPLHRRHRLRVGQRGRGEDGRGQNGADTDSESPRELECAHFSVSKQTGPSGGSGAAGVGETPRADRTWSRRPPVARAAGMRDHRGWPPRRPRSPLRDDPEAEEIGERKEEKV
nr:unnamed protein product [Callosobruchus analis]